MASYNTIITNEGAALLASVIGNQGTLTFSEMRFSTTDYVGLEQSLTAGTFAGTFVTAAASGSIIDTTTIKVASQFDNSAIVGDHPLYSIGIVGTDGNTTALIAVCTTSTPDVIRTPIPATSISTYAFNVNLTVASTQNITVTGTTAAVLYDVDVVNVLTSTATDKPLSPNMGRVLKNNLYKRNLVKNGWFTINESGFTSASGTTLGGVVFANDWFVPSAVASSSITVNANGVTLGGEAYIRQIIDGSSLLGKEVCLSVELQDGSIVSNVGTMPTTTPGAYTRIINVAISANANIELSYNANMSYWQISGAETSGTTAIRAVKLELGTESTLANDIAPDKTLELLKCQEADVSGLSNENLLLNPWFTVNQRGATTVTAANAYGADMWHKDGGSTLTFSSNGVSVASAQMGQWLEKQLPNGIYTISVMLTNGTIYSNKFNKTNDTDDMTVITTADTGTFKAGYTASTKNFWINTAGTSTTVSVKAAKLEVGSKSTLAHDVAPNITAETLKCQRYFYRIRANEVGAYIGIGYIHLANQAAFVFPLPTRFVSAPTITLSGTLTIRTPDGSTASATSIIDEYRTANSIALFVNLSSNLTQGSACMAILSSGGDHIDFSAEL